MLAARSDIPIEILHSCFPREFGHNQPSIRDRIRNLLERTIQSDPLWD